LYTFIAAKSHTPTRKKVAIAPGLCYNEKAHPINSYACIVKWI
jgi:hypothetical protein